MKNLADTYRSVRASAAAGDVVATYYLTMPTEDPRLLDKVERFAVGQTIGTWVNVPGITSEMVDRYQGRVVALYRVPAADLVSGGSGSADYVMRIAMPAANLGDDLAQLLTAVLGNDASTSMRVKLIDLDLPDSFVAGRGPRFGIPGLREWLGVPERPLILNMIKPCAGITPEQGAEIFHRTALGGVDLIKDDELMGNPAYAPVEKRVRAYRAAADRAEQETGRHVVYIPNVSGEGSRLMRNATAALDAGAEALMVCYGVLGYPAVADLIRQVDVPVLGHYAGANMFYEGVQSGMSAVLALGALPRLAGVDLAMLNTPYGGAPTQHLSYLQAAARLALPDGDLKPTMPIVGGGVHPGMVHTYVGELGPDIVLAAGGAVQGHEGGAAAGARAMLQATEAAMAGVPAAEYAQDHEELATALRQFGDAAV